MHQKAIEVLKIMFPAGIPPEKYESALLIAKVVETARLEVVSSDRFISAGEAAKILGITPAAVAARIRRGHMKASKGPHGYQIPVTEVER